MRSMKYRESSRLLTCYTKEFGKVTGIVKGARRAKSGYGASLDPLSHVNLVLSRKASREIQTVTACELIELYTSLREDLERMNLAMQVCEIHQHATHPEEPNAALFTLLVQTLATLNSPTPGVRTMFHLYQFYLARILGFTPVITSCVTCGRPLSPEAGILFVPDLGGNVCSSCGRGSARAVRLSGGAQGLLTQISVERDIARILGTPHPIEVHNELDAALWLYLQSHLPGLNKLRSRGVFQSMLVSS